MVWLERLSQPVHQRVDPVHRLLVGFLYVAVQTNMAADLDPVGDMVEDQQRVHEHELRFWQSQRVALRGRQVFKPGGRLVREVADGAAGEAGQALDGYDLVLGQFLGDGLKGIGAGPAAGADHLIRIGADEAVARQPLAALHALQQKRTPAVADLQEGRYRRLQVGDYLAVDGNEVALVPAALDLFQRRTIHIPLLSPLPYKSKIPRL